MIDGCVDKCRLILLYWPFFYWREITILVWWCFLAKTENNADFLPFTIVAGIGKHI